MNQYSNETQGIHSKIKEQILPIINKYLLMEIFSIYTMIRIQWQINAIPNNETAYWCITMGTNVTGQVKNKPYANWKMSNVYCNFVYS